MKYTIDNTKVVKYYDDPEESNFTGVVRDKNKTIAYYVNHKIHRANGPAVIYTDGTIYYCQNEQLHREGGPAIIWTSGTIEYYLNGKRHREDGPALIHADRSVEYWINHKMLDISTDQELKDYLILRMFE